MDIKYQLEHKFNSAREFEAEGKILHALQVYNSILIDHPGETEVYYHLAELYENMGKLESALTLINSYLETDVENSEMRIFLGQMLLRNERWNEAVVVLSYIAPEEDPQASFFSGYAYLMLKDYELARINFINFISAENKHELLPEAYLYLAKLEMELKNFEPALKYARKAKSIYSTYWELNYMFAQCYYNLDMITHAAVSIEEAIKLNPSNHELNELAGKIYYKSGDYIKAADNFSKFISPTTEVPPDIYVKLADSYLRINKTSDALAFFDLALKIDPGNKQAQKGFHDASLILNGTADA